MGVNQFGRAKRKPKNKRYWDKPVLCDGDGPIAQIRSWVQQFY